jgi:hypothetical protein
MQTPGQLTDQGQEMLIMKKKKEFSREEKRTLVMKEAEKMNLFKVWEEYPVKIQD